MLSLYEIYNDSSQLLALIREYEERLSVTTQKRLVSYVAPLENINTFSLKKIENLSDSEQGINAPKNIYLNLLWISALSKIYIAFKAFENNGMDPTLISAIRTYYMKSIGNMREMISAFNAHVDSFNEKKEKNVVLAEKNNFQSIEEHTLYRENKIKTALFSNNIEKLDMLDMIFPVEIDKKLEQIEEIENIKKVQTLCSTMLKYIYDDVFVPDKNINHSGSTSNVLVGLEMNDFFQLRAIKVEKEDLKKNYLKTECIIMSLLPSSEYFSSVLSFNANFITLEYFPLGSLSDDLKQPACSLLKMGGEYAFCSQLCLGLSYLHKYNIIQGDLKPENILLKNKNGVLMPVIIDFGASRVSYHPISNRGFTPMWAAPEILESYYQKSSHHQTTQSSDLYALSLLVAFVILTLNQDERVALIKMINWRTSDLTAHANVVASLKKAVEDQSHGNAILANSIGFNLAFDPKNRRFGPQDLANAFDEHHHRMRTRS